MILPLVDMLSIQKQFPIWFYPLFLGQMEEFGLLLDTSHNSDKWLEMGGITKAGTTITYRKSFANTNYGISIGICSSQSDTQPTEPKISIKSTTQLKFNQAYNGNTSYNVANYEWRVFGYTT